MENLSLNAELRNTEDKPRDLRASKKLPCVVYGNKTESMALTLDYSEFLKTFRKSGESHIITLKVGKKSIDTLVHEVQKAPVSGDFIHIDFYAITKGAALQTKVSLKFIWESQAVKEGALLEEHLKAVEIKCLPKDLIDSIEVDLSVLENMGDSIRVSDLKVDTSKIEILTKSGDMVASSNLPAKVEIEEEIVVPEVTGADEKPEA